MHYIYLAKKKNVSSNGSYLKWILTPDYVKFVNE